MRIVLASKSPRRKELLSQLISEFEIFAPEVDEGLDGAEPKCGVEIIAIRKGAAAAKEFSRETLVISSDTLVELDGIPLGKPECEEEAATMLRSLSGRTHNVHTGVAVHYRGKLFSGVASSRVHFRKIEEEELLAYVAGGEPMDKAGAYGIQGEGGKFVSSYDGDFDTIVGLPCKLTRELIERALTEG